MKQKSTKALLFLSIISLMGILIPKTSAYITSKSNKIKNEFAFVSVGCEVGETFQNGKKSNVYVTNTGDVDAYIRVKLISYWYDETEDSILAMNSWLDEITPADETWVYGADGYYYYKKPVEPSADTAMLIDEITLKMDESTRARQVLEIAAEAIQADGSDRNGISAVVSAWDSAVESVDPETRHLVVVDAN